MKMRIMQSRLSTFVAPRQGAGAGAATGVFDSSAPLDTQAAQIRNVTLVARQSLRPSEVDHAGTPILYPSVMDRPADEFGSA